MKCCSLSTLGVVIGILNIICYIGLVIFSIVFLVKLDSVKVETIEQKEAIETSRIIFICIIVFCLVMTVISGLLITGIVKKYHKLMLPWISIAFISYFYNCGQFIYVLVSTISSGASFAFIISYIITALLGFTISAFISYAIFKLYKKIRQENIEKAGRTNLTSAVGYQKENF